jgi:DNA-binding NtrC family response regulator
MQHTLESAVVLADGPLITAVHLPTPTGSPGEEAGPLRTLAEVEAAHIQRVLNATSGNQSEAARILGIGRNTLARKLRGEPG